MTIKQSIIAALLRLYPAAWRSEYGPELESVLFARPLSLRVIVNVLGSGFRQRTQAAEPSTILGLVSILVILAGFGLGGTHGRAAVVESTWNILPRGPVAFLAAGVFALLQFICGCWTHLRHGGTVNQSGLAAMKTALITGIPVVLAALLMMLELADLRFPGTAPPAWPSLMLIAPLARLPDAWIWGVLGGLLGRRIADLGRARLTGT